MEGLLLAQLLEQLDPLPAGRGAWRFPDSETFVLPLGESALWLHSAPPDPYVELKQGRSPAGRGATAFQQLLRARAGGQLEAVTQLKLDRVVTFSFRGSDGFVSSPPVRLVAELAGRNANLILLDENGTILGVQREVTADRNRYRQLLPGLAYVAPPAYDRPDPRKLDSTEAAALLTGQPLRRLIQTLDGFGPRLLHAVAGRSGLDPADTVGEADVPRLADALREVLADPQAAAETAPDRATVRERRRSEERSRLEGQLRRELQRRQRLLERRLGDMDHLHRAAERAAELRSHAELRLAFRPQAEPDGTVTVTDFSGTEVELTLEPGQDAIQTAETMFTRARRHEQRLQTAENLRPGLERDLRELSRDLAGLSSLSAAELADRTRREVPADRGRHRTRPGIRVSGPHGFEILIGRNARDNDRITFGIARSRDIWLHVQGYRGSHVIIRADNREVPFETILFAAQLAAGHSQAAASENVPVDWTVRKNVWRPKGAPAGAVHFTAQKTVYVTPVRHAAETDARQG